MAEEEKKNRPPELKGDADWLAWKLKASLILQNRGLWPVIEQPNKQPLEDNSSERVKWEKAKTDACEFFYATLSSPVMRMLQIEGAFSETPVSPSKIWRTLCEHYDSTVNVQKKLFIKLFNDSKLAVDQDAAKWVDHLANLAEEIRCRGGVITFEEFKSKVMDNLPENWDSAVLGLSAVESFIKNEEEFKMYFKNCAYNLQRKRLNAEHDASQIRPVFARLAEGPSTSRQPFDWRNQENVRGSGFERGNFRPRGNNKQSLVRFRGNCHYCGVTGHKASQCRKKARDSKNKASKLNEAANAAQMPGQDDNINYSIPIIHPNDPTIVNRAHTARVCTAFVREGEGSWLLDSGATRHFTNDFQILSQPKKLSTPLKVKTASGVVFATWCGDAFIPLSESKCLHLKGVLYASCISENLLSSDCLQDDGVEISLSRAPEKRCRLRTPTCDIYLRNSGGVYLLEPYENHQQENTAMPMEVEGLVSFDDEEDGEGDELNLEENESELENEEENEQENLKSKGKAAQRRYFESIEYWHKKCAHASAARMRKIDEINLKFSFSEVKKSCECEVCATGKTVRMRHLPVNRPMRLNKLIHLDFCGPFKSVGLSGERLFALFIDDYSRYITVYPVYRRTQIYALVDAHIRNVNVETNNPVSAIRVDNAPEFCSSTFLSVLNNLNVVPELIPSYAASYNGKAERANRTILTMARCMLMDSGLPLQFWTYAVQHAAMVHNRLPLVVLNNRSPIELWLGGKADWRNIHVFGEKVTCRIPKEKNPDPKLAPRGFIGVYLGGEPFKGYIIFCPQSKSITWERDIHYFREGSEMGRNLFVHEPGKDDLLEICESNADDERYSNLVAAQALSDKRLICQEPASWKEAEASPQADLWKKAALDEFESHRRLGTYEVVDNVERGKKILYSKLIFKVKRHVDGSVDKFKARWVICGCGQRPGIDFQESSSSVLGRTPLRFLFVVAVARKMVIEQFDAVTAYLNSPIDQDIFVYAPEGSNFPEGTILKLKKAVYGLKQAGRLWQLTILKHLIEEGWLAFHVDDNVFRKQNNFLSVYVDDFVSFSTSKGESDNIFGDIDKKYKLKRLGPIKELLGMSFVYQHESILSVDQIGYIEKISKKYSLTRFPKQPLPVDSYNKVLDDSPLLNAEEATVYRGITGELQYVSGCIRPDLTFASNFLGRSQNKPTQRDMNLALYAMGFLFRTRKSRLMIAPSHDMSLTVYVDSDLGGTGRHGAQSTGGCIIFLGEVPIFWRSNVQSRTATSSCEAELTAMHVASETLEVVQDLCVDAGVNLNLPTPMYCDNNGAVSIANSGVFGPTMSKRKREFQSLHELCKMNKVKPIHILGDLQRADILTKALTSARHQELAKMCGVNLVYDD